MRACENKGRAPRRAERAQAHMLALLAYAQLVSIDCGHCCHIDDVFVCPQGSASHVAGHETKLTPRRLQAHAFVVKTPQFAPSRCQFLPLRASRSHGCVPRRLERALCVQGARMQVDPMHLAAAEAMLVPGADVVWKYFLAGGICCAASHGGTTPIDVVKTRLQTDADLRRYNRFTGRTGLFDGNN